MTLKDARIRAKLTQTELSELADITQTQLSFIENGKVMPHATTRINIEKALKGYRIDWITTRLQGKIALGYAENESAEDRVIGAINAFIKSALTKERRGRFNFLHEFLNKYENQLTAK